MQSHVSCFKEDALKTNAWLNQKWSSLQVELISRYSAAEKEVQALLLHARPVLKVQNVKKIAVNGMYYFIVLFYCIIL